MIPFLLGATLLSFTLGQLGRISFLNQDINLYIYEIGMIITVVVLFFRTNRKSFLEEMKGQKTIVAFLSILILSSVVTAHRYSPFENLIGSLYLARLVLYAGYFALLGEYMRNKGELKVRLEKYVRWAIYTIGIISLLQILFYPDLRNLFYLGWDEHVGRVFGLFLDTSVAAALYGLTLIYVGFTPRTRSRAENTLLIGLYAILALLTYSRSLYVALLAVAPLMVIKRRIGVEWVIIGFLLVSFAGFMIYRPYSEGTNLFRTASIEARITDYREGWRIFSERPFTGIGYNRIGFEKKQLTKDVTISNHAKASFHSSFLIVLATAGIGGLFAFIWLLVDISRRSFPATVFVVFASIMSLFDNILLHPFVMLLFPFLLILIPKEGLRK